MIQYPKRIKGVPMKIDRYTKVVLTIIAVGIIGINIHLFKDGFVRDANAHGKHTHISHDVSDLERWVELKLLSMGIY